MKDTKTGMTVIVKTITRLTAGLILMYGAYIVLRSHSGPGSGFAGGVIIALSLIHLMLAFGRGAVLKKLSQPGSVLLMGISALAFLYIFAARLTSRHSQGVTSLADIAIALMSSAGLWVIFLALVLLAGGREEE